jgi:hypothetical protein
MVIITDRAVIVLALADFVMSERLDGGRLAVHFLLAGEDALTVQRWLSGRAGGSNPATGNDDPAAGGNGHSPA